MDHYLLCCDWGTSSFRMRLVDDRDYAVLAEIQSVEGISTVFNAWKESHDNRYVFFTGRLNDHIRALAEKTGVSLENIPLLISGMASSSIGIEEISYSALPFALDGSSASVKHFETKDDFPHALTLISGVSGDQDVMRGEEAQLVGLCNLEELILPEEKERIFIFPGTHSKHIKVKSGQITGFRTYMTGEMFSVLSHHSILKDSISLSSGISLSEADNAEAFRTGLRISGSLPILHSLFTVRTNQLFNKLAKEQNSAYLSGLLIGTELRDLSKNACQLVVCSGDHLYHHYKMGVEELGLKNAIFIQPGQIDKATVAGQIQVYKNSGHE